MSKEGFFESKIQFNPDGSVKVPHWEPEPVERKPRQKREFWDIWSLEDIWLIYMFPSESSLASIEKDHVADHISWGETPEQAKRSFEDGFYDIIDAFAEVWIVAGKTKETAIETAWSAHKRFKHSEDDRRDFRFIAHKAEHMFSDWEIQQLSFNERVADIPAEVERTLIDKMKYNI